MWPINLWNPSSENTREKLVIQGSKHKFYDAAEVQKSKHKFYYDTEIQSVLSDFVHLDFSDGPFNSHLYDMNYNEGQKANSFDKISKHYGRNKNIFLFISVLRNKEQLASIINIISKKCDAPAREKFLERLRIYLDRISRGKSDAREFLNDDSADAFFNGYHVACPGQVRNIHANLNINITKPDQVLETSNFFSRTIKRIEEEKSEVKRVKIYHNGKRTVTIEKNEKSQRNYSFTKLATCSMEMSWNAKDEAGKDINCSIVLSINSGQVSFGSAAINCNNAELKDILELAKQNEAVLIKDKALYEVLKECLIGQISEQALCDMGESLQLNRSPDSSDIGESLQSNKLPSSNVNKLKISKPEEKQELEGLQRSFRAFADQVLDVKPKVHDVAIFNDVFSSFKAHFSCVFAG
ncbi:hypothetical protein [Wolbachia endosymbiont of Ctenocephalides felis wCfeT]|uniref:hypothetical protein n=1 Tax=Wolbachia endosymbiont of Ctenocephalides felis wCfeT TaxID=2732593 RepID=UPI001447A28E|nr:hypothetical protein [Wolbachia endosymbiont of Ctenocephalides felis wCfeT]